MEMGMTLASIHNEQDQIAVMEASRGNGGWVGLTDDDHDAVNDHCPGAPGCGSSVSTAEGEWVFTDGTVIGNMDEARHWTPREGAFHNWASGEPGDSSVGEDCAYLKVSAAGLCLACICSSIGISSGVAAQGTRSSTVCDMGAHTVSHQSLTAPLLPLPALDVACGCAGVLERQAVLQHEDQHLRAGLLDQHRRRRERVGAEALTRPTRALAIPYPPAHNNPAPFSFFDDRSQSVQSGRASVAVTCS